MESSSAYVGRLAPAPTGALHPGNARTFLVAWLRARQAGGRLILRLEDLDHPKVKPAAAREVYSDLSWLGLDWDEGPPESFPDGRAADAAGPYVQSDRSPGYRLLLDSLARDGRIYPCVCTRREAESVHSAPNDGEDTHERRYGGACRGRFSSLEEARASAAGREPGWRFQVADGVVTRWDDGFHGPQSGDLSAWSGDFLIARGDRAGYQLAVVADDHAMGVSEVVRGDDLLPSTHRQLVLYDALGYPPPKFYHLPLVVGPDGRRLAKRHGDSRLSVLRRQGKGPERLLGWLAWSCGWSRDLREWTLADLVEKGDPAALPRERVVLTEEAMRWMGW